MPSEVLIAGAGPAGLVLALTLLKNGVPVRIIERQPNTQVGQRGRGIQPRTLEIYEFLGIVTDIIKASGFNPPIHEYPSPQGDGPPQKVIQMTFMKEDTPAFPHNNPRMLGQDRQEALLRERLSKDHGCEVEFGTELRSFEQHEDHVIACIAKNSHGSETIESAKFDWLVGADGSQSVVREQLGLTFLGDPNTPTISMVVGDIRVKSGLNQEAWFTWGDNATASAALRPFETPDDDRNSLFIRGPKVDVEKVASSREEVVKALYDISGRRDIEFGELVSVGIWRPNAHIANKFGAGRAFITGDAAHVHNPAGGQGINSAVQDSFNLGWKLALVSKGLSPASILDSYSNERLPVIASMLNMTVSPSGEITTVKGGGSSAGWVRGAELGQLGVNYRGTALILDDKYTVKEDVVDPYRSGQDGTVRGGDRAPDAPGLVLTSSDTKATRLFEIFQPTHHTVLIFSDSGSRESEAIADILRALTSYPKGTVKNVVIFQGPTFPDSPSAFSSELADLVLVDRECHAYKNYNAAEKGVSIVIVRPDGYIGALVAGISGVKAYFKHFFV